MAEYCVDCWNKINNENRSKGEYITSVECNLCEGCGEYKHTIIKKATIIDWILYPFDWVIHMIFIGCLMLIDFIQLHRKK